MSLAIKTGLVAGTVVGITVTILNFLVLDFLSWVGVATGIIFFITFYLLEKIFGLYQRLSN